MRWSLADGGDPYALAAAEVQRQRQAPLPNLPPFAGGAVGFFGYDCVRTVEPLGPPNEDTIGLPDLALMLTDALVAFDHLKHTVTILANAYVEEEGVEAGYERALGVIAEVRERLAGPLPRLAGSVGAEPEFEPNMPREAFEAMVARIVEYVHAGDAFQVVPSQRWSAQVDVDAFSIYRGLRAINPSPYMYFLDFEDFQIVGASPEPLVTVTGGRATTRPIAGTRPRGGDAEEDQAIAQDLLADEKERAEHVMLVDLGRNDLGRVCEYGSVEVETFMAVETYSHLMHIVSSVAGRLRPDVGPMDALRAILPAGTLSGAPEGARDADHRRARAGQARRLRRRGRLPLLHGRARHLHLHPHGRAARRPRAHAGRRRDGRRRQARLRVRGVAQQGARRGARDRAGDAPGGVAVRVLVIDNYDSFTYNLVQYLGELGAERGGRAQRRRADRRAAGAAPGPRDRVARAVHAERGRRLRRGDAPLPRGGRPDARRVPRPPVARAGVRRRGDPARARCTARRPRSRTTAAGLFAGLPDPLVVGRYHSLVVAPDLPDCLRVTASGGGVVMAVEHRELPAYGVQFHPESVLTPEGKRLLENFIAEPGSD